MNDQEFDRLLRRAMLDAVSADFAQVLAEPDVLPPASPRHERSMRQLRRDPLAWVRRRSRPLWRQALHTAAMFVLVCALSAAVVLTISPQARARVQRWFIEARERDVVYRYSAPSDGSELPNYVLGRVPDGYTLDHVFAPDGQMMREYAYYNASGQWLLFSYVKAQEGAAHSFSTQNTAVRSVTVLGWEGKLFLPDQPDLVSTALTWVDEDAQVQFTIDAYLSEDDLLALARSISIQ